ncbi:MAG: hypothetical protein ACT4N8_08525 [Sphingosinicella sp.]
MAGFAPHAIRAIADTNWAPVSLDRFEPAWAAEVEDASATLRRETVHLATGLLLPVWDKLPDDHVQVVRIAADDGRSLLGREVATVHLPDLGAKLGLDISLDLAPDALAETVLRTGKPLPFRGMEPLTVKRSPRQQQPAA